MSTVAEYLINDSSASELLLPIIELALVRENNRVAYHKITLRQ